MSFFLEYYSFVRLYQSIDRLLIGPITPLDSRSITEGKK